MIFNLVYGRTPIGNSYFLQKVIIFVQLLHDILLKKNDLVNFRLNVFWEPHIHFVLELEFNEMQKRCTNYTICPIFPIKLCNILFGCFRNNIWDK